jgi:hypothetical protein
LTPVLAKLSISPESSDGFASVGTILPKEEATLLPGGLFAFFAQISEEKSQVGSMLLGVSLSPVKGVSLAG